MDYAVLGFTKPFELELTNGSKVPFDEPRVVSKLWYDGLRRDHECYDMGTLSEYVDYTNKIPTGDGITVLMDCAIGDALLATPAIREVEKTHKDVIWVTSVLAEPIWRKHKTDIIPYGLSELRDRKVVSLSNGLMNEFTGEDATDIIARRLGVSLSDHQLECWVDKKKKKFWGDFLKGKAVESNGRKISVNLDDKPIVMFQLATTSLLRTYPPRKIMRVAERLTDVANCIVLGTSDQVLKYLATVDENNTGIFYSLNNLRDNKCIILTNEVLKGTDDFTTFVSFADVIVSPDSAMVHVGNAFNIPTIAIYNSVPPDTRVKYHKNVTVLQGKAECYPCWNEYFYYCKNPDEFGYGKCCESITEDLLYETIKNKLKEKEDD